MKPKVKEHHNTSSNIMIKSTSALLILILLFLYRTSSSQVPTIQWAKSYGGSSDDNAYSICQAENGDYLIVGTSFSIDGDVTGNHCGSDVWVIRLSNEGKLLWQKSYGGAGSEQGKSIVRASDGGFVIAGSSDSNDNLGDVTDNYGGSDCWVFKIDGMGNILWQKSVGGSGCEHSNSIKNTVGGYILAGQTSSNDNGINGNHSSGPVFDAWIVKLNYAGSIVWQKAYGGNGDDVATSIETTTDNGYVVAGYSNSTNGGITSKYGDYDYWVMKLDSVGSIEWQRSYGGTKVDKLNSVCVTSDSYVVAGFTGSNDNDVTDLYDTTGINYWVVKLDFSGDIVWQKTYGTIGEFASSIKPTADNGFVIAGSSWPMEEVIPTGPYGLFNYWVVKVNAEGQLQWQKVLGGADNDIATDIIQDSNGDYVVTGFASSIYGDIPHPHSGANYGMVKLSHPTALTLFPSATVNYTIFPNPATNIVTISIPESLIGSTATVSDVMGRVVNTVLLSTVNRQLSTDNWGSGIYFINVGNSTQKLIITK